MVDRVQVAFKQQPLMLRTRVAMRFATCECVVSAV